MAHDLWQRPRFPALRLPLSTDPSPATNSLCVETSQPEPKQAPYLLSPSLMPSTESTVATTLEELRSFATELTVMSRSAGSLKRPGIQISDRILAIERRLLDLIHSPPASQNALDHPAAVAALIYVGSNVRDNTCNFSIVEPRKLQIALQSLMELGDLWTWGMEVKNRETLVWTVGFGAVSSNGRPERPWFVRLFKDLCEIFDLRTWQSVKVIFENVSWKEELDDEGLVLWEEMQMI